MISAGYSIPTAYAAIYCRLRGSPLIIYSDGTSWYERKLGRHQLLARAVLLRAASACVAKSRPAAERFLELGVAADRIFLAPHSSTMDRLWRIARERDYERRDRFTILTAGRLVPHKGVDRLLLAAARVERRAPADPAWSSPDPGPESERLRRLAEELGLEDVQFRGFVDHGEMPGLYAEADAFAFPTFDDPFGIVLLEAAAAGLPLVASWHAGRDLGPDRRRGGRRDRRPGRRRRLRRRPGGPRSRPRAQKAPRPVGSPGHARQEPARTRRAATSPRSRPRSATGDGPGHERGDGRSGRRRVRLAYLATLYPALSHSFVQREVEALRARGLEIHTFALHGTNPEHVLTEADREAEGTTYTVLPARAGAASPALICEPW